MTLHIGTVRTTVHEPAPDPTGTDRSAPVPLDPTSRDALRETLRPVVLDILTAEICTLWRRYG